MNKPIDLGALLPAGWLDEVTTDRAPVCFPDNTVETAKPGDDEIIGLLSEVYDATPYTVIRWLMGMDLPGALVRDQGVEPDDKG